MRHLITYNEMIKVPIKVGDTVLGGRFKNKKIVVKKIGKNPKGDITINGKPLLKFRIIKEHIVSLGKRIECENMINDCLQDLTDDGFKVDLENLDADYPEIRLTKQGNAFRMDEVIDSILDLNSHLNGRYNVMISRILYKEEVSYGFEDSMKAPQEMDDGWRHTDIENINDSFASKVSVVEILLVDLPS